MPEPRISTIIKKMSIMLEKYSNIKVWDVYGRDLQQLSISAERGAIKTAESTTGKGYAVRVYGPKGNIGFAHSNIISNDAMEQTVNTAVKMLSATNADPDFKDLPHGPSSLKAGPDFFDKKTSETPIEDVFEILNGMLERHRNDTLLYSTSGTVSVSSNTTAIINSQGIENVEKSSIGDIYFEVIAKEDGKQASGWWTDSATALKYLDPLSGVDIAVERAKANLHSKVITSGDFPVVLSHRGVKAFIVKPIIAAISAEDVQYQRTFLGNPLGKSIGSELLNLIDDPFEKRLIGSRYYDDEGVSTRRLDLVKDGTVQYLLHNSYTAFKDGVEPTGHATRSGIGSVPAISPNNLIIPPGDKTQEELLEGIKYGIYLDYTGDTPNLATGDFSALILTGRLIENGELGPGISNTMIGINLRDMYSRIEAIGKDLTIWGEYKIPNIKISSAKITSGE